MKLSNITDNYNYSNNEDEFVFCYKSRPFAVLVSPHLPTPTSSLIDHRLVSELGIKMTEVGCKKFSFAGKKLRILGKVSFTVQCVHQGTIFGSSHFKGSVVENFCEHFDSHAIAGSRLSSQLRGNLQDSSPASSSTSQVSSTPSSPCSPHSTSPKPMPIPSHETSPEKQKMFNYIAQLSSGTKTSPQTQKIFSYVSQVQKDVRSPSPPGFPPTPQYQVPDVDHTTPVIPVDLVTADGHKLDPLSANLAALTHAFANIDKEPDPSRESDLLLRMLDKGGDVVIDASNEMLYYNSMGHSYKGKHGRNKCYQVLCSNSARRCGYIPNNCGLHKQWKLPRGFQYCGGHCRGGFCQCLVGYQDF